MPAMDPKDWSKVMKASAAASDPFDLMEEVRQVFADHLVGLEHHLAAMIEQGVPLQAIVCRTTYTMDDDGCGLAFTTLVHVDPKIMEQVKRSRGYEAGKEQGKERGEGSEGKDADQG